MKFRVWVLLHKTLNTKPLHLQSAQKYVWFSLISSEPLLKIKYIFSQHSKIRSTIVHYPYATRKGKLSLWDRNKLVWKYMKLCCHNKYVIFLCAFPRNPRTGKSSHSEERWNPTMLVSTPPDSTTDATSGRTCRGVPSPTWSCLCWPLLLNTLGSVSDWESPVLMWHPLFKTSAEGGQGIEQASWRSHNVNRARLAGYVSWHIKSGLFNETQWPPGRSSPTLLKVTRKKMQRKWILTEAACGYTLGCPVSPWLLFFPWGGSDCSSWISSKYQTGCYTSQLVKIP